MRLELNVGDRVERVMAVAKKVKREYKGGKFLLFQFSDKEGLLKGVLWKPARDVENGIHTNDIVRISGEIQSYQGEMQLRIERMEKLDENDYDPTLFLPVSSRPVTEIYDDIKRIIAGVVNPHIKTLLETIFGDEEFKSSFLRAPAAKGWHHAYLGGLLEHTYDMTLMALKAAEVYDEIDKDLLIAGILLHDLGKLQEFDVTNHIDYSDRGRLVGHITLGIEFLDEFLRGMNDFPGELELRIKHMILSHHGLLENGSPVVPMTIEALLLHYIDNMDAQTRGTLQVLEGENMQEGNWTRYVKLLDRFIYRGKGAGKETDE